MGVYIKGMEMPKDCVSCRWHARWGCEITGIVTNTAQGCPLIEVPTPHGPLIDADVLERDIEQYHLSDGKFQHWVQVQNSIIEAEEGEEA